MPRTVKQEIDCQRCIETEADRIAKDFRTQITALKQKMLIAGDSDFQSLLKVTMTELSILLNTTDLEVRNTVIALTEELQQVSKDAAEKAAQKRATQSVVTGKQTFTTKTLRSTRKEMQRLKSANHSNLSIIDAVTGSKSQRFKNGLLGAAINHFYAKTRTDGRGSLEIAKETQRRNNEESVLDKQQRLAEVKEEQKAFDEKEQRIGRGTSALAAEQELIDKKRQSAPDVIGYIYLAILDNRTSSICQELHGRRFYYNRSGVKPLPGLHANCRSSTEALYKGEPLPEIETFQQWAKKPENQAELLESMGPTRYKLYIDGKLKISRFNNSLFKPLNLEQMKRNNEIAFTRAGLDEE